MPAPTPTAPATITTSAEVEDGGPDGTPAATAGAGKGARLRVLDGLRLVAALLVVAWHYCGFGHGPDLHPDASVPALHPLAVYGWMGVELFFLISGFVITMSAVGRTVGQFAVSRIVRLFPAYWIAIALTTLVLTAFPIAGHTPSAHTVAVNLTMLQQWFNVPSVDAVYWTLFAELRFYLLFALVVRRGVTYARTVTFCAVWLAVSALIWPPHGRVAEILMPDYAPFFVGGIAYFLIHRYGHRLLPWLLVVASFAAGSRQVLVTAANNGKYLPAPLPAGPLIAVLAGIYLVMAAVACGWLRAGWRWLTVAGAMTYPLYLIHEFIGWTILDYLHGSAPDVLLLAGTVALMLAGAWVIHRYMERPVTPPLRRLLTVVMVPRRHRDGLTAR